MRGAAALAALGAGLLLAAAPVRAADHVVHALPSLQFDQTDLHINVGDTVTWRNSGGTHSVVFDDGSFTQPAMPSPAASWPALVQHAAFTADATFRYHCGLHGGPGGVGMSGIIRVGTGGAGLPPKLGRVSLRGSPSQRALQAKAVTLVVETDAAARVTVSGKVKVKGSSRRLGLRSQTRQVAAKVPTTFSLKLSKKARAKVKRALKQGRKVTALLSVSARDAAGNRRAGSKSVRIKR